MCSVYIFLVSLPAQPLASSRSRDSDVRRALSTCSSAACCCCACTSRLDLLGAVPSDIVPLGSCTSPSSVTLRTLTFLAKVTACAEAASSHTSVSLNTKAITSATSSGYPTSENAAALCLMLLVDGSHLWFVVGGSHADCHKDTSPETGE
jgi:hypothetical protein